MGVGFLFHLTNKDSFSYFTAENLLALPFIIHAFCTRHGGISDGPFSSLNFSSRTGDDHWKILENHTILARHFGFQPKQLFMVHQVHGDDIFILDENAPVTYPDGPPISCDALVTAHTSIAIGIKTADCVPILMVDTENCVIAAVHAGWKGTALALAARVVKVLGERYGTRPEHLIAAVGPAIGPCCYEVDETVIRAMADQKNSLTLCAGGRKGRWMLDLVSANRFQLMRAGIPEDGIAVANICTSCRRDLFFSHRGEEGLTGRQLSFIMMVTSQSQASEEKNILTDEFHSV